MSIPAVIEERVQLLRIERGVDLQITRYWENEYRPGWYCRFRGIVHRSPLFLLEVAGSRAIELTESREDEVDVFLFVNGKRVGPFDCAKLYHHRKGNQAFAWVDLDQGFETQTTLDAITMSNR